MCYSMILFKGEFFMDYDIINQVYGEIISIVNNYARRTNCSYEVARKLSFTLLGYYLVFGDSIFSKLNVLLDSINIYEFDSEDEYYKKAVEVSSRIEEIKDKLKYNPITIWDYKYDSNRKFIGGIPNVLYIRESTIDNVLSIGHEMSHGLEGVSACVDREDDERVYIKQGFTTISIDKETNRFRSEGSGFIELVTSLLETKMLSSFLELDENKVSSSLLQEFLGEIKEYKGKKVMSRSYETLNVVFKDLTDNEAFYSLIKKYFYDNDEEGFKREYESFDSSLRYNILKSAAEHLVTDENSLSDVFYYGNAIRKQAEIFNKVTKYEPDKKLLIVV